ncbi:MAG: hypothetical protein ACP5UQ_13650, partial [Anaerolineae bacterium]
AATYIEPSVEIGRDTVLLPGVCLQGRTRIGAGCRIGPHTLIADSRIGDHCRVTMAVIEGAEVREGATVGPFAHLAGGLQPAVAGPASEK